MTSESVLLIGRETRNIRRVLKTHADHLTDCAIVNDITVATYESESNRRLKDESGCISTDTAYTIPMCIAHNRRVGK